MRFQRRYPPGVFTGCEIPRLHVGLFRVSVEEVELLAEVREQARAAAGGLAEARRKRVREHQLSQRFAGRQARIVCANCVQYVGARMCPVLSPWASAHLS